MHLELRYAGLQPALEQRLRLAANALAAHRIEARAAEWDGTRCDAVAANPRDEYGRRVIEIARRRGTPVLEVGDPSTNDPSATVVRLTRALYDLLSGSDRARSTFGGTARNDAKLCGLVRLATSPEITVRDVEARFQDTVVWLLPSSGRVLSNTVSAQLRAREHLAMDADWTFTPLAPRLGDHPLGEISTSIDAFYLHAAWLARSRLPSFPHRDVSLKDWPDLGSAAAMVEPLAVVQALQRGHGTVAQIARRTGVTEADVGACLWALRASGLLQEVAARAPLRSPSAPPSVGGLFARLAIHFGLIKV